jgi:hypothetical protein
VATSSLLCREKWHTHFTWGIDYEVKLRRRYPILYLQYFNQPRIEKDSKYFEFVLGNLTVFCVAGSARVLGGAMGGRTTS